MMAAAPNLEVLLIGRTLYGLGIGFTMHAAPAYIAEAAPAKVRGLLIRQAAIVFSPSNNHPLMLAQAARRSENAYTDSRLALFSLLASNRSIPSKVA